MSSHTAAHALGQVFAPQQHPVEAPRSTQRGSKKRPSSLMQQQPAGDGEQQRSHATRVRRLERTVDLERRVVELTRTRDALVIKNRMMKQFIQVKTSTFGAETHVTSFLRFRHAQLVAAREELDNVKTAPAADAISYIKSPALYRVISLLGPDFNFLDYLVSVNTLFQKFADKFGDDVDELDAQSEA